MEGPSAERVTLGRIRLFLLGTVAFGTVGTVCELILLGHVESATQWIPLVLLAVGAAVIAWHAAKPDARSVRALRMTMVAFIVAGALGVMLHIKGNFEFQRELNPSVSSLEFFRKTVAGATPILAPGSLVLLGLVGLAHAYRHPLAGSGT